ncbi:hypothetical protein K1719_036972 [Acacia pycnantha]|nr:hypothetical protein K1719_036972 [Acacia pycnantha]
MFEEKERERLLKPFQRTLVVKLLGRQPSYGFMVKKLKQIWERKGQIDIFDLENDFYLVNFQKMDDYMEALGTLGYSDAYLSVARWKHEFDPTHEKIVSVVAWVRLPDLPAPLFDKKFLLNLGNSIGKAIRLDVHTAQRTRGRFARMCVELDLSKPLVPEFNVEGQKLSVVYESLGQICNSCGRVGHTKEGCEAFHRKLNEGSMVVDEAEQNVVNVGDKEKDKERWKTVQRTRRPRRQEMDFQKKKQTGSRFSVLQEEPGNEERARTEVAEQVRGLRSVTEEKEMGKEVPQNLFNKGGQDGGKGQNKENEVSYLKGRGRAVQESKKGKEQRVKGELPVNKHGSERVVVAENPHGQDTYRAVPESNFKALERKGVHCVYKENINPGNGMGVTHINNVGGTMNFNIEEEGDKPPEGASMHMEEECPTANLAV